MRFGVSQGSRIEAKPNARGSCPLCGIDLFAKCGKTREWHWAHKGRRTCDQWWENETPWHRNWKARFPRDWQEVLVCDASGDCHIADIRAPSGLVVEFQHSAIDLEQRKKREQFYGNMVWVLDGERLPGEYEDFIKHVDFSRPLSIIKFGTIPINPTVPRITRRWLEADRTLFLDFGKELWRISRFSLGWKRYANQLSVEEFVASVSAGQEPLGHLDSFFFPT